MGDRKFSTFLFASPSFISGFSRVVDLGGTLNEYNSALSPEMADSWAITSDWQAVGMDMQKAINQYGEEE